MSETATVEQEATIQELVYERAISDEFLPNGVGNVNSAEEGCSESSEGINEENAQSTTEFIQVTDNDE